MSHVMLDQIAKNNFPLNGVSLMFGYGSGVIKQGNGENRGALVDIIIAVDDPKEWHRENLIRNNQHYSFVRYLPRRLDKIVSIQEELGANIYFNPYVNVANLSIKYGVIKTEHLMRDLLHWDKIYVAGRLHKPVEFIVNTCDRNESLRNALRFNKESAIRAALLQLPECFDANQLYEIITRLSYEGDLRMIFGEDKHKVNKIVTSQMDRFDQLYLPIIKLGSCFKDSVQWSESKRTFTQDLSPNNILKNLRLMPSSVRQSMCKLHKNEARTLESDIVLTSLSKNVYCDRVVGLAIASIVRKSSFSQSAKGLMTAGFLKSLRYSHRKMIMSLRSRFAPI